MHILSYTFVMNALVILKSVTASAEPTKFAPENCPPRPATQWLQNRIFEDFLQKFYVEKNATAAILDHMSEQYIQHNPYALSGRQNATEYVGPILQIANFTIAHQGYSNNIGWVHTKMTIPGAPITAVVDIFRFEGTCIMEHWDVATQLPADATNPLALF
ncbi:hypothetical protein B0O99DRAFT_599329 [Bisporella sp. PMI_857]|nr:hypothetical protein B0O99DRAFT_599329 [Bisporella sp. PMI_857]